MLGNITLMLFRGKLKYGGVDAWLELTYAPQIIYIYYSE